MCTLASAVDTWSLQQYLPQPEVTTAAPDAIGRIKGAYEGVKGLSVLPNTKSCYECTRKWATGFRLGAFLRLSLEMLRCKKTKAGLFLIENPNAKIRARERCPQIISFSPR